MIVNAGNLDILYRGFSAAFREGFGQAEPDHGPVSMAVPSTTREQSYGWLGQWPGLREWVGERVLRGIAAHGYAVRNRKFESTVEVQRDDIEDDQYGVYGPMFAELGRASATHPCELVWGLLKKGFATPCYDGQYFFDSDHPVRGVSVSNAGGGDGAPWFLLDCSRAVKPVVIQTRSAYELTRMDRREDEAAFMRDAYRYGVRARTNAGFGLWQLAYGSRQELTAANYAAARAALLGMKGDEGRPMGVRPTHLAVPPSLERAARKLLLSETAAGGETNEWRGTAEPVVTPWLA